MCKCRVVPICFNKDLLDKLDVEVLKEGKDRKKGRAFNRSGFICKAIQYYLDNVSYKKVNYFKVAERKLEKAMGKTNENI